MHISKTLITIIVVVFSLEVEANTFKRWLQDNAQDLDPFLTQNVSIFDSNLKISKEIVQERPECKFVKKLSSSQRVALILYGRHAYHQVNNQLRTDVHTPLSDMISEALEDLPSQTGTAYRYTRVDLTKYKVGSRIVFKGFTSTSSDSNWFIKGRRFGNVFMEIRTTKAKDTSCFSYTVSEKEWLIDQGAEFIVEKRSIRNGIQVIELSEI